MLKNLLCGKSNSAQNQKIFENDGSHRFTKVQNMRYQPHRNINQSLLPNDQDIKFKQNEIYRCQSFQKEQNSTCSNMPIHIMQSRNEIRNQQPNQVMVQSTEWAKNRGKFSFNSNNFEPTNRIMNTTNIQSSFLQMPSRSDSHLSINLHKQFMHVNESSILPQVNNTFFKKNPISGTKDDQSKRPLIPVEEYNRVLVENYSLKKFIQEEHAPLRKSFDKLIKEQEDRDFLISKLEWKVRQLAKEIERSKN